MKNKSRHDCAPMGSPRRVLSATEGRRSRSPIGSPIGRILIWSLMLGFILTSVFFFFIMRQRANIAVQRDTVKILNQKAYLESFADYVMSLDPTKKDGKAALDKLKIVNFDGITGTVTNESTSITGIADLGAPPTQHDMGSAKNIIIEWNKCNANMNGDLYVNNTLYKSGTGDCKNKEYKDIAGPIKIQTGSPKISIKAGSAPFYYRLTSKSGKMALADGKWQMDLQISLVYGKTARIKKNF